MKWRREVNYHGSRSYGSEEPRLKLSSLMIAWFAEIIKAKLRKRRPPPRSPALIAPADCPFPVRQQIRRPDRRVLP